MAGWGFAKKQEKTTKKAPVRKAKAKPTQAKKTPDQKTNHTVRNVFIASSATILFILLTLSTAIFAYAKSFENKALYGTKILGQEIGGMDLVAVRDEVNSKVATVSFSFSVDGQNIPIKPADAGVTFNAENTATNVVNAGKEGRWWQPWVFAAESLVYKISPKVAERIEPDFQKNIAISYALNEKKLADLTQNLSQTLNVQSQNAGLVMKGTDVQVIPAVYGRQIITNSIRTQIDTAVASAQNSVIAIQVERINPNIVEADTQKSIDQAKSILNLPVAFHYKGQNFAPDKATIGGWIIFNTQKVGGKDALVPSVDSKLVYSYVYSLSPKINVPALNKKITVKNGADTTVDQEGKDGLAVDVDVASATTARNLSAGKAVDMELPTYVVKAKTTVNNVTVADWSKYIDVNLSTQTMCAYLAGGNQQACWSITSAATAKGYFTPTGTFLIQRKVYETCMPNPPSTTPLCHIHYVSYFTNEGHAIHEAWWRSVFGVNPAWTGSHGCVNAPIAVAKWIYDWAPIGTPVIIHY